MKSVLLYYPFVLAENVNSGSKLRPRLIYEAFQLWGKEKNIEILLLSGTSKEREHKFESGQVQFCLEKARPGSSGTAILLLILIIRRCLLGNQTQLFT